MDRDIAIPANEFCISHQIEYSFIDSLQQYGLLEIVTLEQTTCIPVEELKKLEQLVRLHYDLNINLEGVDAITHLLNRMTQLQDEVKNLRNRLRRYEE